MRLEIECWPWEFPISYGLRRATFRVKQSTQHVLDAGRIREAQPNSERATQWAGHDTAGLHDFNATKWFWNGWRLLLLKSDAAVALLEGTRRIDVRLPASA